MKFKHLCDNNQTYKDHFKDSMYYSFKSFKCSIYFLCHAFWPDKFKKKGSKNINKLNEEIKKKYMDINNVV